MSKNDRNTVTIGPARVKVEDSIYDAVDQGIVGTTNVTTTTPDTGSVPIGPIGDLITPPTLAPVTGFPIFATDINFNDGISSLPSIALSGAWALEDLSALGSFTNSLLVGSGTDLNIVNLDNPAQRTAYAGKIRVYPSDYIVRDNIITSSWSYFTGGTWVADDVALDIGGSQTFTGATIDSGMSYGVVDDLYTYLALGLHYGIPGYLYAQVPHTGTLGLEISGYVPNISYLGGGPVPAGVGGGVLWVSGNISGPTRPVFTPIDLATGEPGTSVIYTYPTGSTAVLSSLGLSDGSLAFLIGYVVGSTITIDYNIVDLLGGITTQAAVMTVPVADMPQAYAPISGSDIFLASSQGTPNILYQISSAGYNIISGTPNQIVGLRRSAASPGNVRFWGSDGDPSYTNVGLYEFGL